MQPLRPTTLLRLLANTLLTKVQQSTSAATAAVAGLQQRRVEVARARLQRNLELTWAHGKSSSFPVAWLRDNCQCPSCFHPVSRSRTVDWATCDVTIKPKHVQVSNDGGTVIVDWTDAHCSQFSAEWLHTRRFEKDAQDKWLSTHKQQKDVWGSTKDETFPRKRFNFQSIMEKESELLQWLLELERRGVTILEGAGTEDESVVRKLADRVAFIRRTHYGEEFSVKSKMEPSNVAYTGQALQLHTDLPYYEYKPGVNMLHCLVQAEGEGGENQLVDTLSVARQLKENHPEYYDALSTVQVDWTDEGVEDGRAFHSLHRAPVICEDWRGEIYRVNYSQPQRDSHFSVPLEKVETWYLALRQFTQLMLNKNNCVQYKLSPGEVLSFDNLRICHGRSSYFPATNQIYERHIVGAYLDWDEIRSRIRVIVEDRSNESSIIV